MDYKNIRDYVATLNEEERGEHKDLIATCENREREMQKIRNEEVPEIQKNLERISISLIQKLKFISRIQ